MLGFVKIEFLDKKLTFIIVWRRVFINILGSFLFFFMGLGITLKPIVISFCSITSGAYSKVGRDWVGQIDVLLRYGFYICQQFDDLLFRNI